MYLMREPPLDPPDYWHDHTHADDVAYAARRLERAYEDALQRVMAAYPGECDHDQAVDAVEFGASLEACCEYWDFHGETPPPPPGVFQPFCDAVAEAQEKLEELREAERCLS